MSNQSSPRALQTTELKIREHSKIERKAHQQRRWKNYLPLRKRKTCGNLQGFFLKKRKRKIQIVLNHNGLKICWRRSLQSPKTEQHDKWVTVGGKEEFSYQVAGSTYISLTILAPIHKTAELDFKVPSDDNAYFQTWLPIPYSLQTYKVRHAPEDVSYRYRGRTRRSQWLTPTTAMEDNNLTIADGDARYRKD